MYTRVRGGFSLAAVAEALETGRSLVTSGPLVRLDAPAACAKAAGGSPASERAALERAMSEAADELRALTVGDDAMAAEVLEFQIELLGDPSLVEEALAAIADGTSAAEAWQAALAAGQSLAVLAVLAMLERARA